MKSSHESKGTSPPFSARQQRIAIAVVLALGLAAAIGLLGQASPSGDAADHTDASSPSDAEHEKDRQHHDDHEDPAAAKSSDSHEGTRHDDTESASQPVLLTADQQRAAGIVIEPAKPGTLQSTYPLPGEVTFNDDTTAHVVPRVAGVVEAVPVALGQAVRKGQVLAVLSSPAVSDQRADLLAAQKRLHYARATYEREKSLFDERISAQQDVQVAEHALREAEIAVANARQKLAALGAMPDSSVLNRFELRAPFDGTVVEKHLALGEQVREDTNVFTLADLRTVWAQISVPAKDLPLVRVGDSVTVKATAFEQSAAGTVAYVGALIGEATRTAQARVTLQNPNTAWRPGLFVNVEMKGPEVKAAVTVSAEAVQILADQSVVFVQTPKGFIAQAVKVGRSDGKRTEILQGLAAGTPYIAAGSFVAKAELGKSTASHAH